MKKIVKFNCLIVKLPQIKKQRLIILRKNIKCAIYFIILKFYSNHKRVTTLLKEIFIFFTFFVTVSFLSWSFSFSVYSHSDIALFLHLPILASKQAVIDDYLSQFLSTFHSLSPFLYTFFSQKHKRLIKISKKQFLPRLKCFRLK